MSGDTHFHCTASDVDGLYQGRFAPNQCGRKRALFLPGRLTLVEDADFTEEKDEIDPHTLAFHKALWGTKYVLLP